MRIGYFADGLWGHNALDLLLSDTSIEIAFIVPRNDTKDRYLSDKALERGIDYIAPVNINSDDFYLRAQEYECDLFVSMSYNQIFRRRIMNLPKFKTINCHAGKLPMYRGRNILNWVLINDEKDFGITVHYIDEGIDTGDIILQKTFPITDSDNYSTLLNVAYRECPSLLYEAIKMIQNGTAKRIQQSSIAKHGMYCGQRSEGDEIIEWHSTSRTLFNFIRAICKPGPMAKCWCSGIPVYINNVSYEADLPSYIGICGQIIGKDIEGNPIVKTKDTTLTIKEYFSDRKLKVGDRLTNSACE